VDQYFAEKDIFISAAFMKDKIFGFLLQDMLIKFFTFMQRQADYKDSCTGSHNYMPPKSIRKPLNLYIQFDCWSVAAVGFQFFTRGKIL